MFNLMFMDYELLFCLKEFFVCVVITFSRMGINRVWLPILLEVS